MLGKLTVLLAYVLPYRRQILALFLATLLAAGLTSLQPWPIKWFADILSSDALVAPAPLANLSRPALLGLVVIAGVGLFMIQATVDALLSWGWTVAGRRMVYTLAADLFTRLQHRSLLYHSRTAVGESITRVNWDCWALYRLFDSMLVKPVYAALSIALMLVLMSRVDGVLTVIAAFIAPAGVGASLFVGRRMRNLAEVMRSLDGELRSHVHQTLTGIGVVQGFGQESQQQSRFAQIAAKLLRVQQQNMVVDGLNGLATSVSLGGGALVIVLISAHAAIEGRITIGSVLLFTTYLGALQSQLKNVVASYPTVQTLLPSIARIDDVLRTQPEIVDRPTAISLRKAEGIIQFENVSFSFDGNRVVLRNVTFEAVSGQTIALVGPTGAGKSTLVSLIPRFFDPACGRVLLDGRDLRDIQIASLRAQVAVVLQEPFLFPGTIADNIALARLTATASEIEAAARAAHAHEFVANLPRGYDTPVGERGASLSGGERQRISLARAFLKDAPIVILDEPTSAVDAETEASIVAAIQRLGRGRTTFIIAHRLSTIQRADQVLVLQQGAIIERGDPGQLAKAGKLYSRLHALNFDVAAMTK
jgi:ATP-binding cassette subfamily B protein/subfamily B ATP-binding cassette protein MsbA